MEGFEHIWDYFRGKRKGRAANRLEREALSDPFLYEAMEGLDGVEADHERIVKELEGRLRGRSVRPDRRRRLYSWGVAASVLLVAGVAVWLWPAPALQEADFVAAMEHDTAVTDSAGGAVVVAAAVQRVVAESGDSGQFREVEESGRRGGRQVAGMAEEAVPADERGHIRADDTAVLPKDGKDTAGAGKKEAAPARKNVEDVLQNALNRVEIADSRSGKDTSVRIRGVRKPEQQQQEKVIPYSAGKKNTRRTKSVASLGADWNHKAEGSRTWQQRFSRYVADSLRYPQVALAGQVEGEVRLSVRLNKRGHATRIRVLRSVTPECDREAIRLVETYGGVLGDERTGNKIELTVPFRLETAR